MWIWAWIECLLSSSFASCHTWSGNDINNVIIHVVSVCPAVWGHPDASAMPVVLVCSPYILLLFPACFSLSKITSLGVFMCLGVCCPLLPCYWGKSKSNPLEFNEAGLKKASISKATKVTARRQSTLMPYCSDTEGGRVHKHWSFTSTIYCGCQEMNYVGREMRCLDKYWRSTNNSKLGTLVEKDKRKSKKK